MAADWETRYPGFTPKLFERAERAFKSLDADDSGSVATDELGAALENMGYNLTPEQTQQFVRELDSDMNGVVTADEFYGAMHERMRLKQAGSFCGSFKEWKFLNWRKWAFYMKVLSTFMAVVNLFLAISAFVTFASASASVADLAATWDATPLVSLDAYNATSVSACPTGTEQLPRNPYFPGQADSCNCINRVCNGTWYDSHSRSCTIEESNTGCTSSTTSTGSSKCDCSTRECSKAWTFTGLCEATKASQGCASVVGFPAKEMPIWRGLRLCLSWGGSNVVTREQHLSEGTCDAGWTKTCSAAGVATNATVLCFQDSLAACPLSKITTVVSNMKYNYSTESVVGAVLPIIDVQTGNSTAGMAYEAGYNTAKAVPNPKLGFNAAYYSVFDTLSHEEVMAENGVPTRYAKPQGKFALGIRRELGWKNDCLVSRETIVSVIPQITDLRRFLGMMLAILALDFFWSIYEAFKLADRTDVPTLTLRTCADLLCYGANFPLVLLATAAGQAISARITDISGCAPDPALTASFLEVGKKAASLAGTNTVILVLKGFKVLFMSALIQHGIYVLQVQCFGRKKALADIEMAFDVESKSSKNPLNSA